MKNYKDITKRDLILSIVTWSIFILVYWVSFYELYTLCRFGRYKNNIAVLYTCMIFFLLWSILLIIKTVRRRSVLTQQNIDNAIMYSRYKNIWNCAVPVVIAIITCFYGVKIYNSAINLNGKLAWFLHDLKNKRTVTLAHNNIYESGIEGLFTDINNKVHMPEKLYAASNFSLNFDSNGIITSFDTFLYGKDNKGELKSYLISYNNKKSTKITIFLNGYVNANYSDDKLLEPLVNTMKAIPLEKTVSNWPKEQYGILYSGKRSFGYNTSGIVYINSKGNTISSVSTNSELTGYFVSVYVPGKENKYTPVRYKLTDSLSSNKSEDYSQGSQKPSSHPNEVADEFYLSKQVGYLLEITGAAAGSRSYALSETTDGGKTWKTINENPFLGSMGVSSGITFLNEKLGFLGLSKSGGTRGELYRTEDSGTTYKKINLPEVKATLSDGKTYNPFDLPGMPYEQDGILNVLVGQGSDGDYNGGSEGLYQSKDSGITWQCMKEFSKK